MREACGVKIKKIFTLHSIISYLVSYYLLNGAVLVSTGVVRPDKRAAAPDRDKTGTFLKLTDNNLVAQAA